MKAEKPHRGVKRTPPAPDPPPCSDCGAPATRYFAAGLPSPLYICNACAEKLTASGMLELLYKLYLRR